MKNLKIFVLLPIIILFIACSNSNKTDSEKENKIKNGNQNKTTISDSAFLQKYLNGQRKDLINNNYVLNTNLKICITSVCFLELGDIEKALDILPHIHEINIEQDSDGSLIFPNMFPVNIDFYEGLCFL